MSTVLGIESSCDESAVAVVRGTPDGAREILSNLVLSQLEEHRPYGGVVPEIAARAHVEHLDGLVEKAMAEADLRFEDLDAVAATAGPGLIGGVLVGLMTGKALAFTQEKPFLAVNHLEGHALSPRLIREDLAFPYLLLLISGGHCQLLTVRGPGRYKLLGTTKDDAVGEAFDKTAKLLGLGFPGGPAVETAAKNGLATRFDLPRPMKGRAGADFSFSGLKTAVRQTFAGQEHPTAQDVSDIAASFQQAVIDVLIDRSTAAMALFETETGSIQVPRTFVVAGGVAANAAIKTALENLCKDRNYELIAPPPALCTDNGAMIAWAGIERFDLGQSDPLSFAARARWPLADLCALREP